MVQYPPDDELVALVSELGTLKAACEQLGINVKTMDKHLREKRPDLRVRIREVFPPKKTPEEKRAYERELYQRHKEHLRAYHLAKYYENRESNIQRMKEYREQNSDIVRQSAKNWREKNPEYKKQYRKANPDQLRQDSGRRRGVRYTEEAKEYIRVLVNDPCSYCGKSGGTIDHIEPFSKGGSNDADNLTAACGSCNSAKHARSLLQHLLIVRESAPTPAA